MNADVESLSLPVRPLPASPLLGAWTRILPLALAITGAAGVYLAVLTLAPPGHRLTTLFLERGFTQPLTLAVFFWGLGHVVRRLLVQRGERAALERCRQLVEGGLHPDRIAGVAAALRPLRHSLAAPVLSSIVSYFRSQRPARDEVLKVAGQEMDRAFDRVEADYRALTACMWLLPLTGFLGTVVGMAHAIEGFDDILGLAGTDLTALIPTVSGLATAFDTTLLALVLVLPLKLLEVGLEGRDHRLLERIDAAVGAGLVRNLDLAVLAQQTPEERAIDRVNASMERMQANLLRVDEALARLAARVESMPALAEGLPEVVEAARLARRTLPYLYHELRAVREQGERPLTVVRAAPRAAEEDEA